MRKDVIDTGWRNRISYVEYVGNESLEHIMKECEGMERMKGRVEEVLNDDGTGYVWMNKVQRKRKERSVSENVNNTGGNR